MFPMKWQKFPIKVKKVPHCYKSSLWTWQKFPINVTKVPHQCYKSSPCYRSALFSLQKCRFLWLSLSLSLSLSEIHFENKKNPLQQKSSRGKNILPFVTQNQPSVPSLKSIFMKHWQLIENQLLLRQIYKDPPIISHKRGKSLKDILVL